MKAIASACLLLFCYLPISFPTSPTIQAAEESTWETLEPLLQEAIHGKRKPGIAALRKLYPSGVSGSVQGNRPVITPADPNGGPGTRGANIYLDRKASDPAADFAWHQDVWRKHWESARDKLEPLVAASASLAQASAAAEQAPTLKGTSWPAICAQRANAATDESEASHWRAEYAAAIARSADLAAWGHFLAKNQIANLDFQQPNAELFSSMVTAYQGKYRPETHIGRFPGGNSGLYGTWNWLEVERQFDLILAPPASWATEAASAPRVAAARALPPPLRGAWHELYDALPESAQGVWEEALRTPFEQSFVAAALHRYTKADAIPQLAAALRANAQRWGRKAPPMWALLDALPWRAGDGFAGMEFADRFQPSVQALMPQRLGNDPITAFRAIHAAVNARYKTCKYTGLVLTLRDALERNGMDCIRTTDLYGALWRNAGLPGFLNVRQSRLGMGHTIAALIVEPGEKKEKVLILDGMTGNNQPMVWPQAPNSPQIGETVCNELSYRGLDGYVFLEGVIVKGERAGFRLAAEVPYLTGRSERVEQDLSKSRR